MLKNNSKILTSLSLLKRKKYLDILYVESNFKKFVAQYRLLDQLVRMEHAYTMDPSIGEIT